MATFEKLILKLVNILAFIGAIFLIGMIAITCANILSRSVWLPIRGTFELMGYAGAVVTAFALGYTQIKKGHIAVDILVLGYSPRTKKIVSAINNLLCTAFFILAAWQLAIKADNLMKTGEVTETLQIIYYPFTYAVAAGCVILALTLLNEFLKTVFIKKGGRN